MFVYPFRIIMKSFRESFTSRSCRCAPLFLPLWILAGCNAVGPEYQAARIDAPANWSDRHGGSPALQAPADAGSSLPADRWAVFEDPELIHLQSLAKQANQDAKIAALRVLQARSEETIVGAQGGVHVNAGAGVSRQRQSEVGAATRFAGAIGGSSRQQIVDVISAPFTLYQAGFDASWEPDLWGRVLRAEEAASASTEVQRAMLRQVQLSVAAELARAWFQLRSIQRQQALATRQLALAQEMAGLLKERRDAGLSDDSALLGQRSQAAGLKAQVTALLDQEGKAMNRITLLCGAEPGSLNEDLSASRMSSTAPALPDLHLGLPSELARRRPDIAAAEARLHAATAGIGIATADLYPRVRLGATFGYESVAGGSFGEWGSRQWSVGPSLSIPIFDQGRRRATVQLRELQQQAAAVAFQRVVLKAWHEVDDAISSYVAETRRKAQIEERVRNSDEQAALARARYESGLTTDVPALAATSAALDAQREQAESAARVDIALTAIYKALGDGD